MYHNETNYALETQIFSLIFNVFVINKLYNQLVECSVKKRKKTLFKVKIPKSLAGVISQ